MLGGTEKKGGTQPHNETTGTKIPEVGMIATLRREPTGTGRRNEWCASLEDDVGVREDGVAVGAAGGNSQQSVCC